MSRLPLVLALVLGIGHLGTGCTEPNLLSPEATPEYSAAEVQPEVSAASARAHDNACWGQATRAFAQMGEMGEHASQFQTPRLGLRNLARALYDQGVLPDDSMQALGAYVARTLGLSIEACL